MKETLYTIPLNDAFNAHDECPFCNIERKLEQDALDFILGSSSAYMQTDIREQTNKLGFCRQHYKDMFQYGNSLGNAIMLKSYYQELNKNLQKKLSGSSPAKPSVISIFKKSKSEEDTSDNNSVSSWINKCSNECFVCKSNRKLIKDILKISSILLNPMKNFMT